MASLWDKLTGKAPFNEDVSDVESKDSVNVDKSASNKTTNAESNTKDSNIKDSLDKHIFNNNDLKAVAKWALPIVICIILVFVVKAIAIAINDPLRTEIASQSTNMVNVQNEINAKNLEYQGLTSVDSYHQKNNTSSDFDTTDDDAIMIDFLRKYTTWGWDTNLDKPSENPGLEFDTLRKEIIDYRNSHIDNKGVYDIDESFIDCLFPEQGVKTDRDTGVTYYQINYENLNLSFESLSSTPVALISETSTQYAAILRLSVTATDGTKHKTYREVYIVYTIDRAKPSEPKITIQRTAVIAD